MCERALLRAELSANEEMYDAGLLDSDNVFRGAEALRCPHLTAEVNVLFRGSNAGLAQRMNALPAPLFCASPSTLYPICFVVDVINVS
jgi:hypothetical protein